LNDLRLLASASTTYGLVCDRVADGTTFHLKAAENANCEFIALDESFFSLVSPDTTIDLLMTSDERIFHEGPVFFQEDQELYFTTDRLGNTSLGETWGKTAPTQLDQYINIHKLNLATNNLTIFETNPPLLMANGMTKSADGTSILALSQGFNATGGGVYMLDRQSGNSTPVLGSVYGVEFNSLNDIKATQDGIIFVSDPAYGFEQGFRAGFPALGSNIYRFDTTTKRLDLLVTSLQRPNGIALQDDRKNGNGCTLFLTDTGFGAGDQQPRGFLAWSDNGLYALKDNGNNCFDVLDGPFTLQPLASGVSGSQDGIMVHQETKLLMYCDGEGVWVWDIPTLSPIGIIHRPCTQLISGEGDGLNPLYIFAETELFQTELNFDTSVFGVASPSPESSSSRYTTRQTSFIASVAVALVAFVL
jgi:sugar lactone lactonase YvrE